MKTMNIILTSALVLASGSAAALQSSGTAFAGKGCQGLGTQVPGFHYCTGVISSATTAAQIGRIQVYPSKQVWLSGGVSGSAISGLVTPTVIYYLGNRQVATQNISVTTAGNLVNPNSPINVPFFDSLTISQSTPTLISSTNAIIFSVIENDK